MWDWLWFPVLLVDCMAELRLDREVYPVQENVLAMTTSQRYIISQALGRLRFGITICCWIIGVSLATQILIWSLATFTDLRYETIDIHVEAPLIVASTDRMDEPVIGRSAVEVVKRSGERDVDPNRVPSAHDQRFDITSSIAAGAGTLAMLILLPLLATGVMLAAGSATPGVDKVASAFMWALMTGILVLPTGDWVSLPWAEGGLVSYDLMIGEVEAALVEDGGATVFYARFLLLPMACLVSLVLVGLKFAAGVEAAMIPRESNRLDPELEKEAANIKATSLIGGHSSGALSCVISKDTSAPIKIPSGEESLPRATGISPGQIPKRII